MKLGRDKVNVLDICDECGVSRDIVYELKKRLGFTGVMNKKQAEHMKKLINKISASFPDGRVTLHSLNRFEMMYSIYTLERKIDI